MDKSDLIPYLILWAVVVMLVIWHAWKSAGAGLILAYCFQMFLMYWVGAAVHVLPWSEVENTDVVGIGFVQCTYAAMAFAVGAMGIGPWIIKRLARRKTEQIVPDRRLPHAYI